MEKNAFNDFILAQMVEPCRKWLFRFTWQAIFVLFFALIINFIFSYGFTTPKMWHLGKKNNDLVEEYKALNQKVSDLNRQLDIITAHNNDLYHSIFSIEDSPNAFADNVADDEYYARYAYGRYADLMTETEKGLDLFAHRLYSLSLSMDAIEEVASSKDVINDHLPTLWPVDRSLIRNIGAFGWRMHPILRYRRMHSGVDLSGKVGTPIYATGDGQVESANYYHGYGRQVVINHQFGYKTRYAHLSKIHVKAGQWVKRGEHIGDMGNSGLSKGPHLHYEVILRGKPVNPMGYLSKDIDKDEFKRIIENVKVTTFEAD